MIPLKPARVLPAWPRAISPRVLRSSSVPLTQGQHGVHLDHALLGSIPRGNSLGQLFLLPTRLVQRFHRRASLLTGVPSMTGPRSFHESLASQPPAAAPAPVVHPYAGQLPAHCLKAQPLLGWLPAADHVTGRAGLQVEAQVGVQMEVQMGGGYPKGFVDDTQTVVEDTQQTEIRPKHGSYD